MIQSVLHIEQNVHTPAKFLDEGRMDAMDQGMNQELAHHQYLLEKLRADFPDADEQTLADTVDGLTNLTEMLGAVVRSQLDDQALASALRARIAAMQERLSRLESGAAKKRSLVTSVMERAHIMKLTEADFSASLRATQAPLILTDEAISPPTIGGRRRPSSIARGSSAPSRPDTPSWAPPWAMAD